MKLKFGKYPMSKDQDAQINCRKLDCFYNDGRGTCSNISPALVISETDALWCKTFKEKVKESLLQEFDIEAQYKNYLQMVGLDESKMHHMQKQESKRAFMAGVASMFVLFNKMVDFESQASGEEEKLDVVGMHDYMQNQINDYWQRQK